MPPVDLLLETQHRVLLFRRDEREAVMIASRGAPREFFLGVPRPEADGRQDGKTVCGKSSADSVLWVAAAASRTGVGDGEAPDAGPAGGALKVELGPWADPAAAGTVVMSRLPPS